MFLLLSIDSRFNRFFKFHQGLVIVFLQFESLLKSLFYTPESVMLCIFLFNLFVLCYRFLKLFGSILRFVYLPFLLILYLFLLWYFDVGGCNRWRRFNLVLNAIIHLLSHFILLARLYMSHDIFRRVIVNLRDNLDLGINGLRNKSLCHLLDG